MRMKLPVALALLAFYSGQASAGVVITSTNTQLDTKQSNPVTVYADPDKLKVINGNNTIIYRGDLKKFWMIDASRKTYTEMTPDSVQQMGGRLSALQAQMQQRMASLPPAQRAQIEAMMAGRGGALGGPAAKRPPATYTKAGPSKTVANIRCDTYKRTNNGTQDEDICISPLATAGLTAADFKVLDSLSTFIEPLTSATQMPRTDIMDWAAMNKAIGFQGMPMDTIQYSDGKPSDQMTVQKIQRVAIPANAFDLPSGYTQRTMGPPPK
jgi:hypothetical protein